MTWPPHLCNHNSWVLTPTHLILCWAGYCSRGQQTHLVKSTKIAKKFAFQLKPGSIQKWFLIAQICYFHFRFSIIYSSYFSKFSINLCVWQFINSAREEPHRCATNERYSQLSKSRAFFLRSTVVVHSLVPWYGGVV